MLKLLISVIFVLCLSLRSYANNSYPNVSGDLIVNLGVDKLSGKGEADIKKYSSILELQSDLSLNLNRNWSITTLWQSRKVQKDYYLKRQQYNPIISSKNREILIDDEALFIEELKLNFENEDLIFFVGKYNPEFGRAWDKKRRSSIFTTFFARDYQIREKIGLGITALLEEGELSFYPFFNDNTNLSNSAINKRGRNRRDYKISGNTNNLSSYVVKLSGKNFLYLDNLSYHLAYKKIDVDKQDLSEENGYIVSFEYLFKIGSYTSIIPFYEAVKTNNVGGNRGNDSLHQMVALHLNYSSWNLSTSYFSKNNKYSKGDDIIDKYIEYSVGYRVSDNVKIEVSRVESKENNFDYISLFTTLSYFKEF
tara:strand:+ start:3827 stop:4924 length:1098 start_codon:yes stop_codon:yes gene_type:complete